jgi:C-terminal processing protease CtpA/Prc
MATQSPLFEGLSTERPSLLTISFATDPTASLGVQLSNHDNELTNEMFLPGYASVATMMEGETLARVGGVRVGDYIVGVNGEGFRRFPPDFDEEE